MDTDDAGPFNLVARSSPAVRDPEECRSGRHKASTRDPSDQGSTSTGRTSLLLTTYKWSCHGAVRKSKDCMACHCDIARPSCQTFMLLRPALPNSSRFYYHQGLATRDCTSRHLSLLNSNEGPSISHLLIERIHQHWARACSCFLY